MRYCLISLRKPESFPHFEQNAFSLHNRENKNAHENLVRTVRIPRCTSCIFSFPSRHRDVSYLPASTSATRATNMSGAFCEVHHHFGGSSASPMYVYLLNLYTVSFVQRNIGARSLPTFALESPPIPRLLDWPE